MSTAKEKYLASAQKFIAKGQIDRAIKDYEQVVSLDPNDIRHRQRLAEMLVKINRKDDAVAEYKVIGKYYSDNTYFLKAIAVFKQIQKLIPDDIDITLTLATLNEKQGLTGNALTEYGIVLNYYQSAGRLNDALKVLESMLNLDPENLNTQFQFAELHFAAGQADKAYQEFTQLALLLWKQGNHDAFTQVCARIEALFPDQKEFQLDFIAALLEKGEMAGVIPQLQQILRSDATNLRPWLLLADVCRKLGETEKLKSVLQQVVRLFPGEASLRLDLARLHLNAGNATSALDLLAGSEPACVAAGEIGRAETLYGELEKLLPKEKRVFGGLRALYEASGDKEKLAALTARTAPVKEQPAVSPSSTEIVGKAKGGSGEKAPAKAVAPVEMPDWEEEIDLSLPEEMAKPVCGPGEPELEPEMEMEPELPPAVPLVEAPPSADFSESSGVAEVEVEEVEELELEPEIEVEEEVLEDILEAEPEEPVEELEELSPATEEALEPEAELLAEEVLEEFPAGLELEEEPLAELETVTDELLTPDYGEMGELFTAGEAADDELEELQLETVGKDMAAPVDEVVETETAHDIEPLPPEEDTVALVLTIDSENDWLAREGVVEAVAEAVGSEETGVALEAEAVTEEAFAAVLEKGGGEATDELTGFWGEDLDLATLGDELFADDGQAGAGASSGATDKYSLDGLFSAFKKGLDQQVESGDTETHFNLGIAYKEMGLYDDAIGEFERAAHDPQRKVDCITLQAMCYRDKGETAKAEELLREGVGLNGLRKDERQSLFYELAHLLESTARPDEALTYYLEVQSISPGFRDTSARITALGGGKDTEFKGLSILDLVDE